MTNSAEDQQYLCEQVTGAVLIDPSIVTGIAKIVQGRMFVDEAIGRVFDWVTRNPDIIDPHTQIFRMRSSGALRSAKDAALIGRLVQGYVVGDNSDRARCIARYARLNGKESPIFTLADFEDAYPQELPPLIDGLLRQREVMNVIAATKIGKSWLSLGMLMAIATGRTWLGRATAQGRVLLIDNELRRETIAKRIRTVAHAMAIDTSELHGVLDILPLRGRLMDIAAIRKLLGEDTSYSLIVIDAFYRVLSGGVSENDNAQMAGIYNGIDAMAADTGAAIVLIHHSSKGDQSGKSVTDVGSGAGAVSRAADTHLILRPHAVEGLAVLDTACRSFPPNPPRSIRWEYPLWCESMIPPELATKEKGRQRAREYQQPPMPLHDFSSDPGTPLDEMEGYQDAG
jgi:hypothetical protein